MNTQSVISHSVLPTYFHSRLLHQVDINMACILTLSKTPITCVDHRKNKWKTNTFSSMRPSEGYTEE